MDNWICLLHCVQPLGFVELAGLFGCLMTFIVGFVNWFAGLHASGFVGRWVGLSFVYSDLIICIHIHGEDGLLHGHAVVVHEHVDGQAFVARPSLARSHPTKWPRTKTSVQTLKRSEKRGQTPKRKKKTIRLEIREAHDVSHVLMR